MSFPKKIVHILSAGPSLLIDVAERKDPCAAAVSVDFCSCFKCEPVNKAYVALIQEGIFCLASCLAQPYNAKSEGLLHQVDDLVGQVD